MPLVSRWERQFDLAAMSVGITDPRLGFVREYRFCAARRWRFDRAWPAVKIAVEIEGGEWAAGRHTRGSGFSADCEKYNAAAMDGWLVLRFTGSMIAADPVGHANQVKLLIERRRRWREQGVFGSVGAAA